MTKTIGFLLNPHNGDVSAFAEEAKTHAHDLGLESWSLIVGLDEALGEHQCDLLVTVGGDGTFLHGARWALARDVMVAGVNRGRFGFLADWETGDIRTLLGKYQTGDYQRHQLATLAASSSLELPEARAINDIAIKASKINVVRITVSVGDHEMGTFDGDGVIVATPTGSTGYALSAGGPPIDPRLPAHVIVPLASHALSARPVVVPADQPIRLRLEHGEGYFSIDGTTSDTCPNGSELLIEMGSNLSVLKPDDTPNFYARLREKLQLGVPLKPIPGNPR